LKIAKDCAYELKTLTNESKFAALRRLHFATADGGGPVSGIKIELRVLQFVCRYGGLRNRLKFEKVEADDAGSAA